MRILITGHKGFIGQNMVKAFSDHELSLCEWGDNYSLYGIDQVIHLGAISDTRCTDWDALRRQNVEFSLTLIERCQQKRIPIQVASSAAVYGANNTTFCETDKTAPGNMYALSKEMVEQYLGKITPVAPVQIFRYFNVYGPHEDHKGEQASPFHKFREQAKTGTIKIFEGSENFKRDFIHVGRVIEIHKKFFEIDKSGIWNVGTGRTMSFLDVAKLARAEFGAEIETIPMPDLPGYQKFTQANVLKLNEDAIYGSDHDWCSVRNSQGGSCWRKRGDSARPRNTGLLQGY
jgi:ADP-L-glycero-D-manno-heptose 6-epimerase